MRISVRERFGLFAPKISVLVLGLIGCAIKKSSFPSELHVRLVQGQSSDRVKQHDLVLAKTECALGRLIVISSHHSFKISRVLLNLLHVLATSLYDHRRAVLFRVKKVSEWLRV